MCLSQAENADLSIKRVEVNVRIQRDSCIASSASSLLRVMRQTARYVLAEWRLQSSS